MIRHRTRDMRLAVVANPQSRRVRLFTEAAQAAGFAAPRVIAWRDVATGLSPVGPGLRGSLALTPRSGGTPVFYPQEWVRIESPGEDAEVDQLLRGVATPARYGEIVGLRDWYLGFGRAVAAVAAAVDAGGARLLNDPAEIKTLCDKRACHARLIAAGVAVPPALGPVRDYVGLRTAMAEAGWTRVFVKPAHGSSASGVLALATQGARISATTSVERAEGRLFNSLRVRDYRSEAEIASIVDALAPDGLHVERWFPKAALAGRVVDLRVVVIAGRPTHVVVRGSRHPMTNLHLGGARGDLDALRRAAGVHYDAALETCAAVGARFPRSLHVAVDLMFSPDWRRHAVAEVNAFGDLLPGLLVDGRDTYTEQLAALTQSRWTTATPGDPRWKAEVRV